MTLSLFTLIIHFFGCFSQQHAVGNFDCTSDIHPPGNSHTCNQQANWGKCGESWMWGWCCLSCPQSCDTQCTNSQWQCNSDIPPTAQYTCTQQAGWGKCGENWMWGYCCQSCPQSCDSQCNNQQFQCQSDIPPTAQYTCEQQAEWGKCSETWMEGYCCESCPEACSDQCCGTRERRPWSELTTAERNLYINGFRQLADSGIMQEISKTHYQRRNEAHGTEIFLPWHRAFIFEVENAIRGLGGQFECFAMPYWYVLITYFFVFGTLFIICG